MNGKEKLNKALNHIEAPVPIDFGSTAVTGMHISIVAGLREHFGLEKRPVKLIEPYQMLGDPEDDLKKAIGVDVEDIYARETLFGFENKGWKEWQTPWGQEVLVPAGFVTTGDEKGDLFIYPRGDSTVPPSGKMPAGGFYFDSIIRQEPIDEEKLNPEDNLEEFGPVTEEDLEHFGREAENAVKTGRGSIANFGGTGLGDIAIVPAPFLKHPKGIRDVTEWYISTAARQDYIHAVFTKQTEIAVKNLEMIFRIVGNSIDSVFICGTDFGTQTSAFCSTETFQSLYAPYYKEMNGWIHRNTSWKTFKHSCGAVRNFIPFFIEAGFDIINPVQISASGMDPRLLKSEFGDRIVFWGGGVDTQKTLPFGTPEKVRAEVLERCGIFSKGGGFVFNAIHNVQAKSPIENVAAMIDAVHEFNGT
jgi:hypothetical protein